MIERPIFFGKHSYVITHTGWDEERHSGVLSYEDENRTEFTCETSGLAPHEQRQAVVSDILHRNAQNIDKEQPSFIDIHTITDHGVERRLSKPIRCF